MAMIGDAMDDMAAFTATLIDMKIIRTRQCVQFVFEEDLSLLPPNIVGENGILGSVAALAAGKIKCAIARLNSEGPDAARDESLKTQTHALNSTCEKTEKTASGHVTVPARNPLAQRAAIACTKPDFRAFLEKTRAAAIPSGCQVNNYEAAHDVLCAWKGIQSLKELTLEQWEDIYKRFSVWRDDPKYVETT